MFCALALVQWQALMCTAGDVITGINARKVTRAADLAIALDDFKVGDKVTLKVRRGEEGSQVSSPASTSCCLICVLARQHVARQGMPHMLPMPAMMDALLQGLAWLPETVVTMLQDHRSMYFSLPSSCWWCKHDARLLTTNATLYNSSKCSAMTVEEKGYN